MQQGGYAPITGAGLYGPDQAQAAYGIAVPSNVIPLPGTAVVAAGPEADGDGVNIAIPREFWRSSGFGLLLLVALVIYFDVRLMNR